MPIDDCSAVEYPLFSIVVIAYDVEASIERCLRSVLAQGSCSFEVVVVDDASTDRTLEVIRSVLSSDSRAILIEKPHNEGAHLARKTGAAHARGRYLYFLDGDDELCPHLLSLASGLVASSNADVYRLGCRVVQENGGDEQARIVTERALNKGHGRVFGEEILLRSFSDRYAQLDSWRLVSCLYRGDCCRAAFDEMTSKRLGYMEDAYEFFVVASRATVLENATDLIAQRYNLGAGRSGYGNLLCDEFDKRQREIYDLICSVYEFAKQDGRDLVRSCARWFEHACLQTLSNEWTIRLEPKDQVRAVGALVDTWGADATLSMLAAPLTGRASWVLEDDARLDDELLSSWRSAFDPLVPQASEEARSDGRVVRLAALLSEIDGRRRAHEEALRTLPNGGEVREPRASRRLLDALLPPGSRLRRALSAALRELRE